MSRLTCQSQSNIYRLNLNASRRHKSGLCDVSNPKNTSVVRPSTFVDVRLNYASAMADAVEPVRFVADLLEWLDSYPKLIQYNPAGGIIIPDPEKFCSTILSKREGSSNFTSFVRQLNYHGFSKSKTPGSQRGIFTHSHFVRGRLGEFLAFLGCHVSWRALRDR